MVGQSDAFLLPLAVAGLLAILAINQLGRNNQVAVYNRKPLGPGSPAVKVSTCSGRLLRPPEQPPPADAGRSNHSSRGHKRRRPLPDRWCDEGQSISHMCHTMASVRVNGSKRIQVGRSAPRRCVLDAARDCNGRRYMERGHSRCCLRLMSSLFWFVCLKSWTD